MEAFQVFELVHRHADGDWAPLREVDPHDPAALDAERTWLSGARILRCTRCGEEVAVSRPGGDPATGRGSRQ